MPTARPNSIILKLRLLQVYDLDRDRQAAASLQRNKTLPKYEKSRSLSSADLLERQQQQPVPAQLQPDRTARHGLRKSVSSDQILYGVFSEEKQSKGGFVFLQSNADIFFSDEVSHLPGLESTTIETIAVLPSSNEETKMPISQATIDEMKNGLREEMHSVGLIKENQGTEYYWRSSVFVQSS